MLPTGFPSTLPRASAGVSTPSGAILATRLDEQAGASERAIGWARVLAATLIAAADVYNFIDHGPDFPIATVTYLVVAVGIMVLLLRRVATRQIGVVAPFIDAIAIYVCAMWSLHEHGYSAFITEGGGVVVGLACALLAASGGLRFRSGIALATTLLALGAFGGFTLAANLTSFDFFAVQFALLVAMGLVGHYMAGHVRRNLELQSLVQAVFRTTDDAVLLLDPTWRIVDANPAAAAMLGAPAQTLHGKPLPLAPSERPGQRGLDESEGRGVLNGEITLLRPDGQRVAVFASATPVRDVTGQYVVLVAGDLSPLVEARRLLERDRARLADEVEQHTAQLRRTNRELESALLARDRFLATMSHELRTPLHGILVTAESLAEQAFGRLPDSRQVRGVQTILNSGRHLLTQISDILELSRIGSEAPDIQPVSVADASSLALETVRAVAEHKGLRLTATLPASEVDLTVPADARRLQIILVNLLGNAVKFSPPGGEVELLVGQHEDHVVFEVRDTGPGVPPTEVDRIFEPFVQLDSRPVGSTDGNGLGLAVVKELVEQHRGRIQVESSADGGATFMVSLPANAHLNPADGAEGSDAAANAARVVRAGDEESSPDTMRRTCAGRRILLVDDHELNLHVLRDYLATIGLDVLTATDGGVALEIVRERGCDLLVLDMQMPGMDGYDVTRQLKNDPATASIPIVALTAFTSDADRQRSLDAGADSWLARPVSLAELRATIAHWLKAAAPV